MFKFVRNFTLVSIVSMFILTVVLGNLYRNISINQLVEHVEHDNFAIIRILSNQVKDEDGLKVSDMQLMKANQLRQHDNFKLLDKIIRQATKELYVLQVSVVALNGHIVYSTDSNQLAKNKATSASFKKAIAERFFSELVSHERIYTLKGTTEERDTVNTYVAVDWSGDKNIDAVVKLSSDVSLSLSAMEVTQDKVYFYIGLSLSVLFAVLFIVIKQADNNILLYSDEIERQQKELTWHAYRDTLTGLPNRALLKDRLEHAMHRVKQQDKLLAILYVDLDRFKNINDSFGYSVGDELIVQVSERLQQCIQNYDTVSRLGADEFAIMLEEISVVDEASELANRIMDIMADPFIVQQHEIFASFSIGITLYPFDDDHAEQLIQKANAAMYQAKDAGRSTYRFYNPSKRERSVSRYALANALRRAVDYEEFDLYYQPLLHLKTGKILGVEALIRWHSPTQGIVPPIEFISVLEDTGLIIPVGKWVLETACQQAMSWREQGLGDLKINVNISAKQFRHSDMLRQVSNALDESGLPPHLLNLEITESLLINNRTEVIRILEQLNDKGVSISIDDFGTGYSSMAYLKGMPIETIKIDQSFVRGIPHDMDDVAIIHAINTLSQNLRINVIAEGVENTEQLAYLRQLKVCGIQGYLISRPIPSTDFERFLQGHNPSDYCH